MVRLRTPGANSNWRGPIRYDKAEMTEDTGRAVKARPAGAYRSNCTVTGTARVKVSKTGE